MEPYNPVPRFNSERHCRSASTSLKHATIISIGRLLHSEATLPWLEEEPLPSLQNGEKSLPKNGVLGNFELHDWSCTQSYGTVCRIQVLKLSPKAHHFSFFVIWGSWSRRMPGLGCEIVLAATRSRRSPLFKLFSPPLGFLLIADQYSS
jgi:hypothetical protein